MGEEDRDVFRDTPLRLAGYANEVGESFKPLISRSAYLLSYLVAGAYVLGDSHDKYRRETRLTDDGHAALLAGGKALVWQTLASVVIPGFVINRVVAATGAATATVRIENAFLRRYTPTLVGLACIPLIIKPIDHSVDILMARLVDPALDSLRPESTKTPRP